MPQALEATVAKLRRLAGWSALAERTDRQLLEAFAATGNEAAFTILVRRHGALVLGVTRRVLGNAQDAEDAFQATFLVLARKAGSVAWQDCVRNWLHGVAFRVAHKARIQGARRRLKEHQARTPPSPAAAESWHELRGLLDEELTQLPAKYRAPLILCYLEGKTRDEAAEELGWSPGSVKGRLERGREMLRQRLCRRGVTLPAALCAGFLLDQTAFASVPSSLAATAVQMGVQFAAGPVAGLAASSPILQLAQGVLQAMLIAKLKVTGFAITAALTLGLGGALVVQTALAERPGQASAPLAPVRGEGPGVRGQGAPDLADDFGDLQAIFAQEREEKREERREEKKGDERRREERGTRGILKSLDLKTGTITIQLIRDGESGDKTYNLAGKDVKVITPLERTTKLADLTPGVRLFLSLTQTDDVEAVRVEPIVLTGFLIRADAENRTIGVRKGREESKFKVARDARIVLNGRPAELADLRGELQVQVMLDLDRETAVAVQAGRGEREAKADVRRPDAEREREAGPGRVFGTIIDIDQAKGTVNLLINRENNPAIVTYSVTKDTPVRLMFMDQQMQQLPFDKLAKPINAVLALADEKTASGIHIVLPVQRGRIISVDAAKRTVTLTGERERDQITLEVAADAKILQGRRELQLADLDRGAVAVVGLSLDRRHVVGIQVVVGDGDRR
jgi:RNA polymerase sigma factor (sigma-70 family)